MNNRNFSSIEAVVYYALAVSSMFYSHWLVKGLFHPYVRKSFALHGKTQAVVTFDRILNDTRLQDTNETT